MLNRGTKVSPPPLCSPPSLGLNPEEGGGEVEVNRMAVNAEYVRLAVYCSVTVAQSSARQEVLGGMV